MVAEVRYAAFHFISLGWPLIRHADSDIVFLRLLGTPVVVLNSADVATQLLEKRSRIYSDRSGVSYSILKIFMTS